MPNRTGLFSDVLLDTCGGVTICFVLFMAIQAFEWIKKMRALPNRESLLPAAIPRPDFESAATSTLPNATPRGLLAGANW